MGPDSDPYAVVDPTLRVYGVQGLRVIDASIMPTITSGNINAPVIMIGEKGSDLIKEYWYGTETLKKKRKRNQGNIPFSQQTNSNSYRQHLLNQYSDYINSGIYNLTTFNMEYGEQNNRDKYEQVLYDNIQSQPPANSIRNERSQLAANSGKQQMSSNDSAEEFTEYVAQHNSNKFYRNHRNETNNEFPRIESVSRNNGGKPKLKHKNEKRVSRQQRNETDMFNVRLKDSILWTEKIEEQVPKIENINFKDMKNAQEYESSNEERFNKRISAQMSKPTEMVANYMKDIEKTMVEKKDQEDFYLVPRNESFWDNSKYFQSNMEHENGTTGFSNQSPGRDSTQTKNQSPYRDPSYIAPRIGSTSVVTSTSVESKLVNLGDNKLNSNYKTKKIRYSDIVGTKYDGSMKRMMEAAGMKT